MRCTFGLPLFTPSGRNRSDVDHSRGDKRAVELLAQSNVIRVINTRGLVACLSRIQILYLR